MLGHVWVWDTTHIRINPFVHLFRYYWISLRNRRSSYRLKSGAVMTLIGAINIPIIHYSVEWWNTLHQGPTVTKFNSPSIELSC